MKVFCSTDGVRWEASPLPMSSLLSRGEFLDGAFFLVGERAAIFELGNALIPPWLALGRSVEPGFLSLSITGGAGRNYRLEASITLDGVINWQPMSTLSLTSSVQTIQMPMPASSKQFFRAALVPE